MVNKSENFERWWILTKDSSGRRGLSGAQKAEICRLKERGVSQVTLAKQFDISEATVSKIKYHLIQILIGI